MKKPTGEKAIFEKVWERQNGQCFITGQYIPLEKVQPWNFPHVLPKGENKYYHFKLLETNIILTVKRFHDVLDNGSKDQLLKEFDHERLDLFFELKASLLRQYEILINNKF
jgi:hypothetical protein